MKPEDQFANFAYALVAFVIMAIYLVIAWLDPVRGPFQPTDWGIIVASFFAGICSGLAFAGWSLSKVKKEKEKE